jgi:hypothetical protein
MSNPEIFLLATTTVPCRTARAPPPPLLELSPLPFPPHIPKKKRKKEKI